MAQEARSAMVLMMAQIDDATGEVLQDVMERLHRAGARNVQLLASLTKKGRPGQVLLIDAPAEREDDVALALASELGVWGYRVLQSVHRHFEIHRLSKPLLVRVGGETLTFDLGWKRIERQGRLLAVKVEHEHLASLRDALERKGLPVPLRRLRADLEQQLAQDPAAPSLELAF
jgi:pyridinium-3,5-bisthiocarboxylic acid mononucleotide nickel chelatase